MSVRFGKGAGFSPFDVGSGDDRSTLSVCPECEEIGCPGACPRCALWTCVGEAHASTCTAVDGLDDIDRAEMAAKDRS